MLQYFSREPSSVNVTVLSGEPAYVSVTVLNGEPAYVNVALLRLIQHTSILQYFV